MTKRVLAMRAPKGIYPMGGGLQHCPGARRRALPGYLVTDEVNHVVERLAYGGGSVQLHTVLTACSPIE